MTERGDSLTMWVAAIALSGFFTAWAVNRSFERGRSFAGETLRFLWTNSLGEKNAVRAFPGDAIAEALFSRLLAGKKLDEYRATIAADPRFPLLATVAAVDGKTVYIDLRDRIR